LHDEFGQSVTAIRSMALAIAQGGAGGTQVAQVAHLIASEAGKLYDDMHGLIPRLAPLTLDTDGLAATLNSLVGDWQRRHPSVELALRQDLPRDLGCTVTLAIYRVVQEGLINALRHARASRVEMVVEHDDSRIHVRISDDGAGLPADWARPGHFGLRGIEDRVRQLGGRFRVANQLPRGAALEADIPIAEHA
jgi:two-component system sensor histidine kinase UhpB